MKTFLTHTIILFCCLRVIAQSQNKNLKEPEVGKPCPNFSFNKIDFYKDNHVNLKDLKGRWVVLSFWSTGCSSCISGFPGDSRTQINLGDKIQIIMVAPDAIPERQLFTNYHKKLNLAIPSAFDSEIFDSFNVGGLPHTIIIDPDGIVRVITIAIREGKLKDLVSGKETIFPKGTFANQKDRANDFKYDPAIPYLIAGNGGPDSSFAYRSLLNEWQPREPLQSHSAHLFVPPPPFVLRKKPQLYHPERVELLGYAMPDLYMLAYSGKLGIGREDSTLYGNFWPTPVLEGRVADSLKPDKDLNKNYFNYSLIVPQKKATKENLMKFMQSDLNRFFGFEVAIEIRKMPYWRLTATKEAKRMLESKGTETTPTVKESGFLQQHFRNFSMSNLLDITQWYANIDGFNAPPLLDETGILTNIDVDLDWLKGDLNIVKGALRKKGLDLVKGEKEMKVIVIRDPK